MTKEQIIIIGKRIRKLEKENEQLRDIVKDIYRMYKEIVQILEDAE